MRTWFHIAFSIMAKTCKPQKVALVLIQACPGYIPGRDEKEANREEEKSGGGVVEGLRGEEGLEEGWGMTREQKR